MNPAIPQASLSDQQCRMRRDLIDLALTACETANAAGQQAEPWVFVLTVELQNEQGRGRVPASTVDAHGLLLNLQAAYLGPASTDRPPAGTAQAVRPAFAELGVAIGGRAA
jgi:hypothetical protein